MADLSNLSKLTKTLQEQVDIITAYLEAENLPSPSFTASDNPSKPAISGLPPSIEHARMKAYSLSWGLNTLLATPANHLALTLFQVFSIYRNLLILPDLRCRGSQNCDGEKYPFNNSSLLFWNASQRNCRKNGYSRAQARPNSSTIVHRRHLSRNRARSFCT